jgi:hypothetical protein
LCRIAKPTEPPYEFQERERWYPDHSVKYHVLAVRRFTSRKQINWWTRRGEGWRKYLRIGDVMIVIDKVSCRKVWDCGTEGFQPIRYFVRKVGPRWVWLGGHQPVYRGWEKPPKL